MQFADQIFNFFGQSGGVRSFGDVRPVRPGRSDTLLGSGSLPWILDEVHTKSVLGERLVLRATLRRKSHSESARNQTGSANRILPVDPLHSPCAGWSSWFPANTFTVGSLPIVVKSS